MLASDPQQAGTLPAHAYFDRLRAAWDEACDAAGGPVDRDIEIGAQAVRLRFAGGGLVPALFRALAHLAVARDCEPALTIHVWDSHSTGVTVPELPLELEEVVSHRIVPRLNDDRFRMRYEIGYGGLTMFDSAERTAVFWVHDEERIPWHDRAAPLRTALNWAVTHGDRRLVHAGAVAVPGGGAALIGGRSGSGKSTLCMTCMESGLDYLGDDYVLLSLESGRPSVHSLFASAKADARSMKMLPALASSLSSRHDDGGGKAALDLLRHRADRLRLEAPVSAVVLPRVTGANPPVLRRIPGAHALRALAPSTVLQIPHDRDEAVAELRALQRLVAGVPCYAMEQGPDLEAGAALLAGVLSGEAAA